ncbi:pyridoxal phosphate-dependent aminotransferase [Candidatus Woesearchaeota archaeon]|nr:pyridoxal phosphate-dependent aminotransferase [Candidatus Woesearchaeota archaeon]MBT5272032.1 pyridoxal phosphate-dependent aminotransferase [Candidatus Woesearchaeota archaeon]MBT6040773.1 pyridoxal phosphate-dependent aminotransferase [Candidatus Woesearchaeota archaeon]MBT6336843.1 pyridoxal phosphate-dependent aminotransferase [Candidatus Woesearchaeota archaeon]MBT7927622.1 pyridoxal phosphate-dependent aminotransferase [Candidatus Woesearchaeota archaeon]
MGTENSFVVLAKVNKLIAEGKPIISFCIGQPDFRTPENINQVAIKAINDGKSTYTASDGIPELKKAAADYFTKTRKVHVTPESVVVGSGGKPFIMYTIGSVTQPGQGHEVIFPNPGYPIYSSQTIAQGAKPVPLPLLEEKKYNFDMDDLKKKMNANTRLLILNSPQNPTGGVLSKDELYEIAEIVKPYPNCWVYSDEVYSELVFDGEFNSIVSVPGMQERTVIVDSSSKTFAMPGWRIGYAANEKLAPHLARWVTNTDSCATHLCQHAAVEALNHESSWAEVRKMKKVFDERRNIIVDGLNSIPGFRCLKPGGAFYAWPNVTEACEKLGCKDSEELRERILNETHVAVLSDNHFGTRNEGEGQHIRFSYATSTDHIKEGIARLKKWVEDNS